LSASTPTAERLAVAGSGVIACGLAATAARHGPVLLWARSDESAQRAQDEVARVCGRLTGAVNAAQVTVVTSLAELSAASFIVEAVVEDEQAKSALLAELGGHADSDAVLATTTSSLSVGALAQASGHPERFIGLHVFNPVARMKLVEIVFPQDATERTRERALALCDALGKTAVEVPDVAGFVVNRLLFPYLFSAVVLMGDTGMAAADVDACMTLGAGHPMGPLALLDLVGLDVAVAIGEAIDQPVPEAITELVATGALGRKSGRGFYDYS
jgi:3-hydroxybutyryl-CoA dehydrogenase